MADHEVPLNTLKDCLQFLQWLKNNDIMKGRVANRLGRLLNGKYKSASQSTIEPALSQFLSDVNTFHRKLCKKAGKGKYRSINAIKALEALIQCIPKVLSVIYFLQYHVDNRFVAVGGGRWANHWPGYDGQFKVRGGELQEYLTAKENDIKYNARTGVIPGGFGDGDSELRQNDPQHGYPLGGDMVKDLQHLLDKHSNENNLARDIFVTSVLSKNPSVERSNVANALRLVEDFCGIFEKVEDEQDFRNNIQARHHCISWQNLKHHCIKIKKSLRNIFKDNRFSFTGYAREYDKLKTQDIATKMAKWLKNKLDAIRIQLGGMSTKLDVKTFVSRYLFPHGFTFNGYKFGEGKDPYQVMKADWNRAIKELTGGEGLQKLKTILDGNRCEQEKEDVESDDDPPLEELEDLESEEDSSEPTTEATKIEAAKPMVTISEAAQNQGKKAEGAQNQGKKAEGAQNSSQIRDTASSSQGGYSIPHTPSYAKGDAAPARPPGEENQQGLHGPASPSSSADAAVQHSTTSQSTAYTPSPSVQPSGSEPSGAAGSGSGRSTGGQADSSGADELGGQQFQKNTGDGNLTFPAPSTGPVGSEAGGGGGTNIISHDQQTVNPPDPLVHKCRNGEAAVEMWPYGFTYCPRDVKPLYVSEGEMYKKWDEWNRQRDMKLERKRKEGEEKLRKKKEAEERKRINEFRSQHPIIPATYYNPPPPSHGIQKPALSSSSQYIIPSEIVLDGFAGNKLQSDDQSDVDNTVFHSFGGQEVPEFYTAVAPGPDGDAVAAEFEGHVVEEAEDEDTKRHMRNTFAVGNIIPPPLPKLRPNELKSNSVPMGYPIKPPRVPGKSTFHPPRAQMSSPTLRRYPNIISVQQKYPPALSHNPPSPITESIDDLATARFLNVSGTSLTKSSKADANAPVLQKIDPPVPQSMLSGSHVPDAELPSSPIPRATFLTEPQPTMRFQIELPKRTVRKLEPEVGLSIEVPPHEDRTFNDVDLDDPYANTADIIKDELRPAEDKGFSGMPDTNFDLNFAPERIGLEGYDDPGMPRDSPRKADERVIKPFSTDECLNPWSVDTSTSVTSPPTSPPPPLDHLSPPQTVREMLYWFVGLSQYGFIGVIAEHFKSILMEINKDTSQPTDAIEVTGDPDQLTSSHVTVKLTEASLYSATVIYKINHNNDFKAFSTFDFRSEYSKFRYATDPACLLCQLRDYVYACHYQLQFLKAQCNRGKSHGGWQACKYGSDITSPNSPLQAFLTDGWDSDFKTHPFDPCNLCLKSRVRMGFRKDDLPEKSENGITLSTILTPSCGGEGHDALLAAN